MKSSQYSQTLAAFAVSIGTFIFGIFLAWSSPAVPKLLEESDLELSSLEIAWIASVMSLGESISTIPAGMIRNRFGTKASIAIYSIPSIFGWIFLTFVLNSWTIIFGRFLCGIAGGGFIFLVPIYIGEIASKDIRGRLVGFVEVNMTFGILFIFVIVSVMSYQQANIVCGIVSILYMIIAYFLPESPVYLLKKGKIEEARKSLELLRKKGENVEEELNDLQSLEQNAKGYFFKEMKNPGTRKAFVIIIVLFIMFQTCGINAIMFYSTQILIDSGMDFDPFLSTIMLGLVQVVAVVCAVILVDHKGRKFLLFMSFTVMAFGLIMNGIFFHLRSMSFELKEFAMLPFIGVLIYLIGFNLGLATATFVLMSEIFSISAKKVVAPLGMIANFSTSFLVTLSFPPISAHIGMHLMFYFFAFSCILGIIFTWKFIPETKGKSLSEIQKLLNKAKDNDMTMN